LMLLVKQSLFIAAFVNLIGNSIILKISLSRSVYIVLALNRKYNYNFNI
jgi:hypothetical protein